MSLFVGESKFLLLWMMATVFNAIFSVPAVAPLPTAPAGSRRTQVFGRRAVDPESNLSRIQMPSDFAEQDCPSPSRNSYPTIGWEPTSEAKRPKVRQRQRCHQKQSECSHLTSHLSKRSQSPQLMQEEQCSNRQWYPCDRIYDLTQCASWQQLCVVFRKSGTLQKILYCSAGVVSVLDFQGSGCISSIRSSHIRQIRKHSFPSTTPVTRRFLPSPQLQSCHFTTSKSASARPGH